MHIRRSDELFILLAVRSKGNTAMEEYLQIRPYLFQMLLAGKFHDTHQHAEHPARNTRDIGYVLIHRFAGNKVAFHFEIAQESG